MSSYCALRLSDHNRIRRISKGRLKAGQPIRQFADASSGGARGVTRPRKSPEYRSDIRTLLRNAKPLWSEIQGESDERKRLENERARDIATDELLKIYREALTRGALDRLPREVRNFCED